MTGGGRFPTAFSVLPQHSALEEAGCKGNWTFIASATKCPQLWFSLSRLIGWVPVTNGTAAFLTAKFLLSWGCLQWQHRELRTKLHGWPKHLPRSCQWQLTTVKNQTTKDISQKQVKDLWLAKRNRDRKGHREHRPELRIPLLRLGFLFQLVSLTPFSWLVPF